MEVAACFVHGCVVPIEQAWQWLLWSAAVGSCVGFAVTGVAGRLLDFFEARAARRERIDNARYRYHSNVPPMYWRVSDE